MPGLSNTLRISTAAALLLTVSVAPAADPAPIRPHDPSIVKLRRIELDPGQPLAVNAVASSTNPSAAQGNGPSGKGFQGQSFPARKSLGSMIVERTAPPRPAAANPIRLLPPEIEPEVFRTEFTESSVEEELPPAPTFDRPPGGEIPYNFVNPPAPSTDRPPQPERPQTEIPYNFLRPESPAPEPTPEGATPQGGSAPSPDASVRPNEPRGSSPPPMCPVPPAADCATPVRGLLVRPPRIPGVTKP